MFVSLLTLSAHATDVTVSESAAKSQSRVTCDVHADHRYTHAPRPTLSTF
jgi:hypothetical protein